LQLYIRAKLHEHTARTYAYWQRSMWNRDGQQRAPAVGSLRGGLGVTLVVDVVRAVHSTVCPPAGLTAYGPAPMPKPPAGSCETRDSSRSVGSRPAKRKGAPAWPAAARPGPPSTGKRTFSMPPTAARRTTFFFFWTTTFFLGGAFLAATFLRAGAFFGGLRAIISTEVAAGGSAISQIHAPQISKYIRKVGDTTQTIASTAQRETTQQARAAGLRGKLNAHAGSSSSSLRSLATTAAREIGATKAEALPRTKER
jgi:hypothetical protein